MPGLTDLIIKGTRVYGGAWVFDPASRHDDGLFEVVPFAGKRDWISKALVHLDESGAVQEGLAAIGVTHSQNLSAARIEVDLRRAPEGLPLAAQIDGEEFPATPRAEVDVLPRALRLIVPEKPIS
jgi:diacylglycerol kinase family enzyme